MARPLIVVGSPRSGTSMIGAYVGSSTSALNLGEYAGFDLMHRVVPTEYRSMSALDAPAYLAEMQRHARQWPEQKALAQGASWFVASAPWNLLSAQQIANAEPDALFLLTIRDVRGVAQSLRRTYDDGHEWAGATTQARIELWSELYRNAANIPTDRLILFDYDRFASEPAAELDRLDQQLRRHSYPVDSCDRGVVATRAAMKVEARRPSVGVSADEQIKLAPFHSFDASTWTTSDEIAVASSPAAHAVNLVLSNLRANRDSSLMEERTSQRVHTGSLGVVDQPSSDFNPEWLGRYEAVANKLFADLRASPHVTAIWIHGSRAIGSHWEGSDLDVAVVVDRGQEEAVQNQIASTVTYIPEFPEYFDDEPSPHWTCPAGEIGMHFLSADELEERFERLTSSVDQFDREQAWFQHIVVEGRAVWDPDSVLERAKVRLDSIPTSLFLTSADRNLKRVEQKIGWWEVRTRWKTVYEQASDIPVILNELVRAHYALNRQFAMPGNKEYERDAAGLEPNISQQMMRAITVNPHVNNGCDARDAIREAATALRQRYIDISVVQRIQLSFDQNLSPSHTIDPPHLSIGSIQ